MDDDRRKTERRDIALDVHVEIQAACSLSDVSETGARLTVRHPTCLPDEFQLVFNRELRRWCRVKWRSETQVGVEFIAAPAHDPSAAPSPQLALL
ncbi:MAG: PilZ domain-containing protein [Pseudomonadota bacterium]